MALYHSNQDATSTKPVVGSSEKAGLKPACSAPETSQKIDISLVVSLYMTLSNKRMTKALV